MAQHSAPQAVHRLPDPLKRALRTFIDAVVTTYLTLAILPQFTGSVGGQPVPKWSALGDLAAACAFAGVMALMNWLKNYLEDNAGVTAIIPK